MLLTANRAEFQDPYKDKSALKIDRFLLCFNNECYYNI